MSVFSIFKTATVIANSLKRPSNLLKFSILFLKHFQFPKLFNEFACMHIASKNNKPNKNNNNKKFTQIFQNVKQGQREMRKSRR